MRFLLLIILINLWFLVDLGDTSKFSEDSRQILERYSLSKMDLSSESRKQFKAFLAMNCLVEVTPNQFLTNYIQWEEVEFKKSVREFLEVPEDDSSHLPPSYHDLKSNCSYKDYNKETINHEKIIKGADFENYLYDIAISPLAFDDIID